MAAVTLDELRRDGAREDECIARIRKAWRRFNRVVRGGHVCPRKSKAHRRMDSVVCIKCWSAAHDFVLAVDNWQHAAWAAGQLEMRKYEPSR